MNRTDFEISVGILLIVGVLGFQILEATSVASDPDTPIPIAFYQNKFLGYIIAASGKMLDLKDAHTVLTVKSLCACRTACWSLIGCRAFSIVPKGNSLECRLTKKKPNVIDVIDANNATYIYRRNAIASRLNRMAGDQHLYLVPDQKADFATAKAECLRLPGYRLAIMKTFQQLRILDKLYGELDDDKFYVDLQKTNLTGLDGAPTWGDGTPLHNNIQRIDWNISTSSNEKMVFRCEGKLFNEEDATVENYFLCQAYPNRQNDLN